LKKQVRAKENATDENRNDRNGIGREEGKLLNQAQFPKDFRFGVATSSYQIEGSVAEDGRGVSIWDVFSHTEGKVHAGDNGDIACDYYHRYEADIRLMKSLGVNSYRFSIAWPRIFPQRGQLNQKGIDFYKRILATLREFEIEPVVTLYHWDLPQYLQDKGGWVNRQTVDAFVEYATVLFQAFDGLVTKWITHNEPWCASFLSYGIGEHAPGHTDWREAVTAAHHLLLSHGRAVQTFRRLQIKGEIGITLNLNHVETTQKTEQNMAARNRADGFQNRWFLNPVFKSAYPADMVELFEKTTGPLDFVQDGDLEMISSPIDFLGVNYYNRAIVVDDPGNSPLRVRFLEGDGKKTAMGWEIHFESMGKLLERITSDYTTIPLYITENGAAFDDVLENSKVHDKERVDFLSGHFGEALQFIQNGGNLKGFYIWSFLDNFEWAHGYSKRFGIIYVDFETQERYLKDSAIWYRNLIQQQVLQS
jgi:beta-glucosidase